MITHYRCKSVLLITLSCSLTVIKMVQLGNIIHFSPNSPFPICNKAIQILVRQPTSVSTTPSYFSPQKHVLTLNQSRQDMGRARSVCQRPQVLSGQSISGARNQVPRCVLAYGRGWSSLLSRPHGSQEKPRNLRIHPKTKFRQRIQKRCIVH